MLWSVVSPISWHGFFLLAFACYPNIHYYSGRFYWNLVESSYASVLVRARVFVVWVHGIEWNSRWSDRWKQKPIRSKICDSFSPSHSLQLSLSVWYTQHTYSHLHSHTQHTVWDTLLLYGYITVYFVYIINGFRNEAKLMTSKRKWLKIKEASSGKQNSIRTAFTNNKPYVRINANDFSAGRARLYVLIAHKA